MSDAMDAYNKMLKDSKKSKGGEPLPSAPVTGKPETPPLPNAKAEQGSDKGELGKQWDSMFEKSKTTQPMSATIGIRG